MAKEIKIYFSGSIGGGMDKAYEYRAVIQHLRRYGKVLTDGLWDSELHEALERNEYPKGWEHLKEPRTTYRQDVNWVEEADIVIADVSVPSIGVGYEVALAERLGKMVVCLYDTRSPKKLSWMVSGNPYVFLIQYNSLDEVLKELDRNFRISVGVGELVVLAEQGWISQAELAERLNIMGVANLDLRSI